MARAYYNENEPFAANWLRNLIDAGLIMAGEVDERSIHDVQPSDTRGFTRCHFFAGIGGWDYALRLAGWPDDRPVWTGSCPCQPFSSAGKGKGADDPRHLWPEFYRLIGECRPPVVFGEQVASKAGREWLGGVFADLEGVGYAAAGADLCAASLNAPHTRQRLWWVADTQCTPCPRQRQHSREVLRKQEAEGLGPGSPSSSRLGSTNDGELAVAEKQPTQQEQPSAARAGWDEHELIRCLEPTKEPGRYVEKWRRVEPGTLPLAHGIPGRVGRLRGYGNAIVPQVAAEFIGAYMDL